MSHLNNEIEMTVKIEGEAHTSWDGIEDQVIRRMADHFISDHKLKLREKIEEGIQAHINQVIENKIAELTSKPIPPRDRFGEPIEGEKPKTLTDMLCEAVDEALKETVDTHSGKPKRRDQYNYATPRLEYLFKRVVSHEIDSEFSKAVKKINADALAAVQERTAKAIATQLTKAQ